MGMLVQAMTLAAIAPVGNVPACRADRLVLALDGRDGDFNGMSHAGTLVVLRNRGRAECTLPALPAITFRDARGRVLPARRRPPAGMHPGPVMLPVTVPAGGAASAPVRWVSGAVFDRSRCLRPVRLAVAVGGGTLSAPLAAHVCGPAGAAAMFDQPPLAPGDGSAGKGETGA